MSARTPRDFPPGYRTKQAKAARALRKRDPTLTVEQVAHATKLSTREARYALASRREAWKMLETGEADDPREAKRRENDRPDGRDVPPQDVAEAASLAKVVAIRPDATNETRAQGTSQDTTQIVLELLDELPSASLRQIAKIAGVSTSTVQKVVAGTPNAQARLSAKRQALTVARLETAVLSMAEQLDDAMRRGALQPDDGSFRDWMIAMGIAVDKYQLLTGGATQRTGVEGETAAEKRERLTKVLEGAEKAIRSMRNGSSKAKLPA